MFILSALPPIGPLVAPLAPITLLLPHWSIILFFALATFYLWLSYWPGRRAKVIPIRASPFSPDKVPAKLDTIVIGSGSGGSSCANILAQSGQRVLLLEQHEERTGGCTHSKFNVTSDLELGLDMLIHNYISCLSHDYISAFRINGCEWDTGLHYTSAGMGLPTHRAGALQKFMSRGKQEWKRLYAGRH